MARVRELELKLVAYNLNLDMVFLRDFCDTVVYDQNMDPALFTLQAAKAMASSIMAAFKTTAGLPHQRPVSKPSQKYPAIYKALYNPQNPKPGHRGRGPEGIPPLGKLRNLAAAPLALENSSRLSPT